MNMVILEGRLGRDPEVRVTQGGQKVCNFTMATSQKYTDKKSNEKKEKVQWHRITAWGTLAERAGEFLAKGRRILLQGRVEYSEYTDKDKVQRYSTTIVANQITFLDSASKGATKDQVSIEVGDDESVGEDETPAQVVDPAPF